MSEPRESKGPSPLKSPKTPELILSSSDMERLKSKFTHRYKEPKLDPSVFVAPGAQIFGDVEIGRDANIWFNAVMRGDVNYIRIGQGTNIQDLSMIHVSYQTYPCLIGDFVTVGHS